MIDLIIRQLLIPIVVVATLFDSLSAKAQITVPDTVTCGVYITSIHNIDFKEKEYTINLWLWLKYKNRKFDFLQNLEVPQAKTVNRSFATIDSSHEKVYLLMKLQCVMKDEWATENFPFDKQKLRFSIENSQFDSKALVFLADTQGKQFDPRFTLRKWSFDSVNISVGTKIYETSFGDPAITTPKTEYSTFRVRMQIERAAMGLFWKMFLGMYLAFLIAYMCFYIHTDNIDSRFSLSVGALFAVIGNKYIVDSSLPESTTFTLVDTLHGITLFFILIVMAANSYVLKLAKQGMDAKAKRVDLLFSQVLLAAYLILNVVYIYRATRG
jgi:hypothetical protein